MEPGWAKRPSAPSALAMQGLSETMPRSGPSTNSGSPSDTRFSAMPTGCQGGQRRGRGAGDWRPSSSVAIGAQSASCRGSVRAWSATACHARLPSFALRRSAPLHGHRGKITSASVESGRGQCRQEVLQPPAGNRFCASYCCTSSIGDRLLADDELQFGNDRATSHAAITAQRSGSVPRARWPSCDSPLGQAAALTRSAKKRLYQRPRTARPRADLVELARNEVSLLALTDGPVIAVGSAPVLPMPGISLDPAASWWAAVAEAGLFKGLQQAFVNLPLAAGRRAWRRSAAARRGRFAPSGWNGAMLRLASQSRAQAFQVPAPRARALW